MVNTFCTIFVGFVPEMTLNITFDTIDIHKKGTDDTLFNTQRALSKSIVPSSNTLS